jgi:NCS1 family nucleobase:cation symporter-1
LISPATNVALDSDQFAGEYAPDARLYNDDLAPTMPAQRTWGTYNYVALWFSMSMEVTTYMLAASLIAGGMNWKQAVGTILIGNLIVLVPMLLNAHAGAKYGIPFPVFVRASFGPVGANLPAMLRAIVACGWLLGAADAGAGTGAAGVHAASSGWIWADAFYA